jgi:hypothetical protein
MTIFNAEADAIIINRTKMINSLHGSHSKIYWGNAEEKLLICTS